MLVGYKKKKKKNGHLCNSIFIQSVTDNLEFPDWSSFLQWKEREETHATQSQMELKKTKMKVYNSMISFSIHVPKRYCSAEMERQRKITAQRKALVSEGPMGHVN